MPLHFKYTAGKVPPINPDWLRILSDSADSPVGLIVLPEPRTDGGPAGPALTGRASSSLGSSL
jgi:hypothetical protein